MKMELRQIKNGFLVNLDGNETYYETADQATRKILPMVQELLTDWQRQKDRGKVTIVFELVRMT
jgi:hypothetical protein